MTETTITHDQLKAFRNADSAVFRWQRDETVSWGPATGIIELHKEIKRTDGFGDETLRVEIPCNGLIHNYGNHSDYEVPNSSLRPAISGTWVLLYTNVNAEWRTIAGFLKAGDVLTQEWVVDNRNQLLTRAHLTQHELKFQVDRTGKDGKTKRYVFVLDGQVSNPFGLADNVKRAS